MVTSGIAFISQHYIYLLVGINIVTSDMTVTPLATLLPERQSLVPIVGGVCGGLALLIFVILLGGVVICKKSKYIINFC